MSSLNLKNYIIFILILAMSILLFMQLFYNRTIEGVDTFFDQFNTIDELKQFQLNELKEYFPGSPDPTTSRNCRLHRCDIILPTNASKTVRTSCEKECSNLLNSKYFENKHAEQIKQLEQILIERETKRKQQEEAEMRRKQQTQLGQIKQQAIPIKVDSSRKKLTDLQQKNKVIVTNYKKNCLAGCNRIRNVRQKSNCIATCNKNVNIIRARQLQEENKIARSLR
jgi:hypothetical protein